VSIKPAPAEGFETVVPVLIVGAGAAGLSAALAAREAGAEVAVLERDSISRGSTELSAGLVPAAGTPLQREAGIIDDAEAFAVDIRHKNGDTADAAIVALVAHEAAPAIEWLADTYGLPFSLVHDFDYPGHARRRMHGVPSRSGVELSDRLNAAAEAAGVLILTEATVAVLFSDDGRTIRGVEISRPDGRTETIGCQALILACNGYGGHPQLVAEHIPQMAGSFYFGHPGNRGDAVLWGAALGARLMHMSGYQGHGSVAHPFGVLITWAVIMEGGFQINSKGLRFSDESRGYSEQAAVVIAQPTGIAWDIFDERIAAIARQFEDFRQAEMSGAVIRATSVAELAMCTHVPPDRLAATLDEVERLKTGVGSDGFGRMWAGASPLTPPYCAVRVTGALFHTQGGLAVDTQARVLDRTGAALPNLFATGGAAVGVSGPDASGYLSGNGLLTAVVLGRLAGAAAARLSATCA